MIEKMIYKKTACDKYENALLQAAAGDGELDAKLARHLEQCSACRTTLRAKRELFAQIDSALRAQMDESPSPDFLPQLRLKLSNEPTAEPQSNHMWHLAAAALALVLIAMLYPLMSGRRSNVQQASIRQANVQQSSVQGNLPVSAAKALPNAGITQSAHAAEGLRANEHLEARPISAGPAQPEVLVPPDEQKAFEQFVARVAGRDARAEAVVNPASDNLVARNAELPRVASVDMAALQFTGAEPREWMAKRMIKTGESE